VDAIATAVSVAQKVNVIAVNAVSVMRARTVVSATKVAVPSALNTNAQAR
jgi:hypothetical protein